MLNEQIESVMRSALLSTSKNNGILLKDVRIKMYLSPDMESVDCMILNKVSEIEPISWNKILGMKPIVFYSVSAAVVLAVGVGIYFLVKKFKNQTNE